MQPFLPFIIGAISVIVGLCFILIPRSTAARLREKCTVQTIGKCIRIDEHADDEGNTYRPVYEINFKNQKYELPEKFFSNKLEVQVGDSRNLYINPEKPTEFYDPNNKSPIIIMTIIGVTCLVGGILVAILLAVTDVDNLT